MRKNVDSMIEADRAVERGTVIATAVEVYKDLPDVARMTGRRTLRELVHRLYGAEAMHKFDEDTAIV